MNRAPSLAVTEKPHLDVQARQSMKRNIFVVWRKPTSGVHDECSIVKDQSEENRQNSRPAAKHPLGRPNCPAVRFSLRAGDCSLELGVMGAPVLPKEDKA